LCKSVSHPDASPPTIPPPLFRFSEKVQYRKTRRPNAQAGTRPCNNGAGCAPARFKSYHGWNPKWECVQNTTLRPTVRKMSKSAAKTKRRRDRGALSTRSPSDPMRVNATGRQTQGRRRTEAVESSDEKGSKSRVGSLERGEMMMGGRCTCAPRGDGLLNLREGSDRLNVDSVRYSGPRRQIKQGVKWRWHQTRPD